MQSVSNSGHFLMCGLGSDRLTLRRVGFRPLTRTLTAITSGRGLPRMRCGLSANWAGRCHVPLLPLPFLPPQVRPRCPHHVSASFRHPGLQGSNVGSSARIMTTRSKRTSVTLSFSYFLVPDPTSGTLLLLKDDVTSTRLSMAKQVLPKTEPWCGF